MAVTFKGPDYTGRAYDQTITNLTAQLAVISQTLSPLHYHAVKQALDQAQKDAVAYYLSTGRITAATVLSTLS